LLSKEEKEWKKEAHHDQEIVEKEAKELNKE